MPYSRKARYYHNRRAHPREFDKKTFRNVPASHVKSLRKKYPRGTRVIVGKRKKTGRWGVQSVLIPKKRK